MSSSIRILSTFAAVICCTAGLFAQAHYLSAANLANDCRAIVRAEGKQAIDADYGDGLSCVAYIKGAMDAYAAVKAYDLAPQLRNTCVPAEVKTDQVARTFLKRVDEKPEVLHISAAPVLWEALLKAFPCSGTGGLE
jgi:hypothetical protein